MKSAWPFFLLSCVSLVLWLRPGARFVLTVEETRALMEVEGFALFFCGFLSIAIVAVFKSKAPKRAELLEGEISPLPGLLFIFFMAFVVGGSIMWAVGGAKIAAAYWIVLVLHVLGTRGLSEREMRVDGGANGWGMLVFVGLGFLAIKAHIFPPIGNHSYPSFDGFWGFKLEGQQVLGWACLHFAVLGYLHLSKERIFGRLVDRQMELERKR